MGTVDSMSPPCIVCTQVTSLSCVCGCVHYCSSSCQKSHWSKHKSSCPPVRVRQSPGKGQGVFAVRNLTPGQLLWSEHPLITYKKDPNGSPAQLLQSLYKVFQSLDESTQTRLLSLYDPGEEPGLHTELWRKVGRICNVNEVQGANQQHNSVFEKYSRLNHSCNRNTVGHLGEDGTHQVRAVRRINKGEELTVSYLEGKLAIREERQAVFQKKWGFVCVCQICSLGEVESRENDDRIKYVREMQSAITRKELGVKSGRQSHTKSLQDLHKLLAACYRIQEQNQSVMRCVLVGIIQGLRKVGGQEADWSVYCPKEVRQQLEDKLGTKFWQDLANYEREAMRVADIFGYGTKMVEYIA